MNFNEKIKKLEKFIKEKGLPLNRQSIYRVTECDFCENFEMLEDVEVVEVFENGKLIPYTLCSKCRLNRKE